MRQLSDLLNGLTKSLSVRKDEHFVNDGRQTVEDWSKDAKKKDLILCRSGNLCSKGSDCFVSTFSHSGQKGINQDCSIVWKEFGCRDDMMFFGLFDGHGPWGHFVAKSVRKKLPVSLLYHWQETLALTNSDLGSNNKPSVFDIWKQSYLKACAETDKYVGHCRSFDSFHSGTTALTMIKQGEDIIVANVGDSRSVLATISDDGALEPVQLTVDFKPNLPQESERIIQYKGRVFCLHDEPGVHRMWLPNGETPGLALSRAFGDYCVKDYGLISVPEVTQRRITSKDQFLILATDGVWDVISNQEAVQIVSSSIREKRKAAKRLVCAAICAWKRKRKGIAMDDCSAICLFFNHSDSDQLDLD